jgi:arylsulfatase
MIRAVAPLLVTLALLSLACDGAPQRRDLLLISVDTLRADRLGAYGHALGLSPHLDALAADSQVFERAYSTASYTLPAVISLLTGRQPDELGIRANVSVLRGGVPTLATRLWTRGWRTGAVVSNAILRRRVGIHVGFDHYDDQFPTREQNRAVPERIAEDTTDAALAMFDALRAEGGAPVFLWVHYQDPHGPYTPPEGYRERYLASERRAPDGPRELPFDESQVGEGGIPAYQRVGDAREVAFYRAGYDGEIRYVDEQIGRLLAELERRHGLSQAVVVLTADHGEGLGERDYWFAHGEHLTDPVVRIPLFVRAPGLTPGRRTDVASLVDLVPTLTRLVGAESPQGLAGRDLFAPGAERENPSLLLTTGRISSVPREGLIRGGYQYLVALTDEGPRESLFRLGELEPEPGGARREVLAELRGELLAVKQRFHAASEQVQSLSDAELEQLEALGYVGQLEGSADAGGR